MCSSYQTPMLVGGTSLEPAETPEAIARNAPDLNDSLDSNANDQSHLLKREHCHDSNSPIILTEVNAETDIATISRPDHLDLPSKHQDGQLEATTKPDSDRNGSNQHQEDSNIQSKSDEDLEQFGAAPVLEVEQNHYQKPDNPTEQGKPSTEKKQASLKRQQKMDDSPLGGSSSNVPHTNNSKTSSNSSFKNENKENKPFKKFKCHSPLRLTVSLGERPITRFKPPSAKAKQGMRENQWRSLEVPSITVRSEDDITNSSGSLNGHGDIMDIDENGYLETNSKVHDLPRPPLPLHHVASSPILKRQSLPLNYAQRQILTKSLGRNSGNRLQVSYSLDVPQCHRLHQSHSLSTLEPGKMQPKENQQFEFINIEDKLISSSLNRLESPPSGGKRRLSWTPGIFPRGSKGSIHDRSDNGNGNSNSKPNKCPQTEKLYLIESVS